MAHRVLLVIGQNDHVFPTISVHLVQESGHLRHIVDASSELIGLAKIVDAYQQGLSSSGAVGILELVARRGAVAKGLRNLWWRRWERGRWTVLVFSSCLAWNHERKRLNTYGTREPDWASAASAVAHRGDQCKPAKAEYGGCMASDLAYGVKTDGQRSILGFKNCDVESYWLLTGMSLVWAAAREDVTVAAVANWNKRLSSVNSNADADADMD